MDRLAVPSRQPASLYDHIFIPLCAYRITQHKRRAGALPALYLAETDDIEVVLPARICYGVITISKTEQKKPRHQHKTAKKPEKNETNRAFVEYRLVAGIKTAVCFFNIIP